MNLAQTIEHTKLDATATPADVERLCREAIAHEFFGVCVAPHYAALAERQLRGTDVRVVSVVGFPLGSSLPEVKAEEARRLVAAGVSDVDMVMAIGLAAAGDWAYVAADVALVRAAVPDATLKVILETGCFDDDQIRRAAEVAVSAGADFVKTSTGFGPRGATVADVELLRDAVGDRAAIKASGGIRTGQAARDLVSAGATRLGTSAGVVIATG